MAAYLSERYLINAELMEAKRKFVILKIAMQAFGFENVARTCALAPAQHLNV